MIRVYEIYATKENVSNIHYAEKICSLESDKDCQNADSIKAKITSLYSDAQDQDRIQKFVEVNSFAMHTQPVCVGQIWLGIVWLGLVWYG